mmetsp:Transcript_7592/g.6721  ORF Transcript_7592/g.6721 Transcript_7592/m.6721 type:complete len:86 (+) Transcript_7592:27-284(+)
MGIDFSKNQQIREDFKEVEKKSDKLETQEDLNNKFSYYRYRFMRFIRMKDQHYSIEDFWVKFRDFRNDYIEKDKEIQSLYARFYF